MQMNERHPAGPSLAQAAMSDRARRLLPPANGAGREAVSSMGHNGAALAPLVGLQGAT